MNISFEDVFPTRLDTISSHRHPLTFTARDGVASNLRSNDHLVYLDVEGIFLRSHQDPRAPDLAQSVDPRRHFSYKLVHRQEEDS